MFFERNQPLTAVISRNMNLEFMCCILYGLSEIYIKPMRKVRLTDETGGEHTQEFTFIKNKSNTTSPFLDDKGLSRYYFVLLRSDFYRAKNHKIRYKKIFDEDIDLENLRFEVTSTSNRGSKIPTEESEESEPGADKKEYDAMVIEYCPKIFRELRNIDDITGIQLYNSLNPVLNSETMNRMRESEGKSGSFFFFSHDNNFLIKTITAGELSNMLGCFMKSYYEHVTQNEETLLAKIYGIFSIEIKYIFP
jgi:hypothetical protein